MRGIGHTFSRLSLTLARIAGAAIVAGTLSSIAFGQTYRSGNGKGVVTANGAGAEEVAMAVPRLGLGVVVPRPLQPGDTETIKALLADAGQNESLLRAGPSCYGPLEQTVSGYALRGQPDKALRIIAGTRVSPACRAGIRSDIARILFTQNNDMAALEVVALAVRDTASEDQPSRAFYVGGLAAWRMRNIALASLFFEAGAKASLGSPAERAASAFWAWRAEKDMNQTDATKWLLVAAEQGATLYGILARHILGMDVKPVENGDLLSQADIDAVADTDHGWRAFALLQLGETDRAAAELRMLWVTAAKDPVFARALQMVASTVGLMQKVPQVPVPVLRPAGGFKIDPALVYAVARVESGFQATAVSAVGARGLMQIMPETAQYLSGDPSFDPHRLNDPALNLRLGQRYVEYLSRLDGVGDDLLRVLASYNSGPNGVLRWAADIRDMGDPLLFIEAIPVAETRHFVTRTLTSYWEYAQRLHRPTGSLDAMAAGEFPRFTPVGGERKMALSAGGSTHGSIGR